MHPSCFIFSCLFQGIHSKASWRLFYRKPNGWIPTLHSGPSDGWAPTWKFNESSEISFWGSPVQAIKLVLSKVFMPPRDPAQRKLQHTNWAANLCRTIGLMKTRKLSLKKKLSQLNAMILARSFVNKCLDRVAQKDPEVLMELNKSWTPHIAVHPFHRSEHELVGIACIPYFCFAISGFTYMDMLIYYFKCLHLCKQNFQLIKHG